MHWLQVFWPKGRTNRAPYWVISVLLNVALTGVEKAIPIPTEVQSIVIGVVGLVVVYIAWCLFIGRFHDLDRSGWWSLPLMLCLFVVTYFGSSPEMKDFVFKDPGLMAVVVIGSILVVLSVGIGLGFVRGTQGPNRFGPDPLVKAMPA